MSVRLTRRSAPAYHRRLSMAQTFDTAATVRDLESAGMERAQAEAIAAAIRNGQGDLVTKDHLKAELAGLESRLVKWAVGIAAVLLAAIKLIPGIA